jgi:hypothetical protein
MTLTSAAICRKAHEALKAAAVKFQQENPDTSAGAAWIIVQMLSAGVGVRCLPGVDNRAQMAEDLIDQFLKAAGIDATVVVLDPEDTTDPSRN